VERWVTGQLSRRVVEELKMEVYMFCFVLEVLSHDIPSMAGVSIPLQLIFKCSVGEKKQKIDQMAVLSNILDLVDHRRISQE